MSSTSWCSAVVVNTPRNRCSPVTSPSGPKVLTPTKYGYAVRCTVLGTLAGVSTSSRGASASAAVSGPRSEEHTSELQSPCNLVCRLLLEKKKKISTRVLRVKQDKEGQIRTRRT